MHRKSFITHDSGHCTGQQIRALWVAITSAIEDNTRNKTRLSVEQDAVVSLKRLSYARRYFVPR